MDHEQNWGLGKKQQLLHKVEYVFITTTVYKSKVNNQTQSLTNQMDSITFEQVFHVPFNIVHHRRSNYKLNKTPLHKDEWFFYKRSLKQ